MLREISNDKLTPKKSDLVVETEIYKKEEDGYEVQEEWEMDDGSIELTDTSWPP